jgi:hypothetical protein
MDPQAEHVPTVEEGRQMFLCNAGLSMVVTTEGQLTREGLVDGKQYVSVHDLPIAEVRALLKRLAAEAPRGPLYEVMPTVAEAWAMFVNNPGLAHVMTESGTLSRDGTLRFPRWSR